MLNESFFNSDNEKTYITGEELANLLNAGDVYRSGVEQIKQEEKRQVENFSHQFNTLLEKINKVYSK